MPRLRQWYSIARATLCVPPALTVCERFALTRGAAEPVIHDALEAVGKPVVLLYCPVVRASYKGNPQYPYRVHPQLRLKAVPTFYRWGANGPIRSLVEGENLDQGMMQDMVE